VVLQGIVFFFSSTIPWFCQESSSSSLSSLLVCFLRVSLTTSLHVEPR
jgi:hypothetical protein